MRNFLGPLLLLATAVFIGVFCSYFGIGNPSKPHEKYIDPASVETPSDVRPACLYKYSSEVQLRTCPSTDAEQEAPDEL